MVRVFSGIAACAMLGALVAAQASDAPSRNDKVEAAGAANRVIALREHAGWNAACEAIASPALFLDEPPRHGQVCARDDTITIRALNAGTADQCIGHRVQGVRLEYRPYAGYAGGDGLRYAVQYPSARRAIAVNVTVRGEGAQVTSQPIALDAPPQQAAGPVPLCADLLF
jgi:hypothetical protein